MGKNLNDSRRNSLLKLFNQLGTIEMTPEWVTAIATCILAVGILIAVWQLIAAREQVSLLRQQVSDDHDRSRRSEAIRAITDWTKSLDKAQPSARVLVNSFSIDQCRMLRSRESFEIDSKHLKLLEHILQGTIEESELHKLPMEGGKIRLNEKHLSQIYFLAAAHLNSLEVCLQHWVLHTADKDVIESEMNYLINPEKNEYVLENFRIALGGARAFPAIELFVQHIKNKLAAAGVAVPRGALGKV